MNTIKYRKGFKYQLAENFSIQIDITPVNEIETEYIILTTGGWLYISEGYAWDGPSGPMVDTDTAMCASLAHDALYQLMRMGFLPLNNWERCDMVFKKICLAVGMWSFRAWYALKGLNVARGEAAKPKNKKKIYSAPAPD